MERITSKRKNRSRSPSPLTDLPLEVQLETEDENGKLVPMIQLRSDVSDEYPNTCELCGRSFPNSTGLRTHERSHNGPAQNQLKISGALIGAIPSQLKLSISPNFEFHQESNIVRLQGYDFDDGSVSMSLASAKNKAKWLHKCGQCAELCTTAIELRLHLKRNHKPTVQISLNDQGESPYWKDGMFYVCTYCGKSFLHIVGFRSHWRRHEREDIEASSSTSGSESREDIIRL